MLNITQTQQQVLEKTGIDPHELAAELQRLGDHLRSLSWYLTDTNIDIHALDNFGFDLYCGDTADQLVEIQQQFKQLVTGYNQELLDYQQAVTKLK